MSEEPEAEEAPPTAVVPFEEPEATAKPTPASSVLRLVMGRKGPQLATIDDALKYATACHRSGLLPEHVKSPQQAYVIMDNGRELGLGPWASWKLIYITRQGRIAIMSKGALAVVQACPNYEDYTEQIEMEGTEEMRAVATATRKGRKSVTKTFSLDDAKAADLLSKKKNRHGAEYDGPWQAYVKDMLLARARDRALSVAFAAELAGIEPETIAEDADRLEAKAAGVPPAVTVGVPKEIEAGALDEPPPVKALPEPKPDPLLAFVLKGQRAQAAADAVAVKAAKALEADRRFVAAATVAGVPPLAALEMIEKSVDEALPAKKAKAEPKRYKVGDIIRNGTRRVVEVDDDGRVAVVEKVSVAEAVEIAAAQRAEKKKTEPAAEERPKKCPREQCGAPLNLLGDCDRCGWPNAHYE
jgi:hypothetical protein